MLSYISTQAGQLPCIAVFVLQGSRFYENELKKEQQVNQRIEKMMHQKARITEEQLQKAQVQVRYNRELLALGDLGIADM